MRQQAEQASYPHIRSRRRFRERQVEEKQKAEPQQWEWKAMKSSPSWSSPASSSTEWQGSSTWWASKKSEEHPYVFFWKITRVSLTSNGDSLESDEECEHYTHLACTRAKFSRACGSSSDETQCLDCSFSVRVIQTQSSHSSHVIHLSRHLQSTSTSSSPLWPANWTPFASPLFGRFAEQIHFHRARAQRSD